MARTIGYLALCVVAILLPGIVVVVELVFTILLGLWALLYAGMLYLYHVRGRQYARHA